MSSWSRIVLHADLDAFYAAVEELDDPSLRGRPLIVGPPSGRGVVLTANYAARPFGVRSAMPMAVARRRCPQAVIVPPRFSRYTELSRRVMKVFADFSPSVEAISLDEAFLEMTGAERLFGDPWAMGRKLKAAVREATGLVISVGISGTKYVAKVCSDLRKPDGLVVVHPDQVRAFLAPLPVERLWGVGPKTGARLRAAGLETIGDLAVVEERALAEQIGAHAATHFRRLALGEDPRRVARRRRARSVGLQRTLATDTGERGTVERYLRASADGIARRLRKKQSRARGVRVHLRSSSFQTMSRQRKLLEATDVAETLFEAGAALLDRFDWSEPFRRVGMAAFDLVRADEPAQLSIFAAPSRRRRLESVVDAVAEKFGASAVIRAEALGRGGWQLAPDLDCLEEAPDEE